MTIHWFLANFKIPEQINKGLVKRIKEKLTDKNGEY